MVVMMMIIAIMMMMVVVMMMTTMMTMIAMIMTTTTTTMTMMITTTIKTTTTYTIMTIRTTVIKFYPARTVVFISLHLCLVILRRSCDIKLLCFIQIALRVGTITLFSGSATNSIYRCLVMGIYWSYKIAFSY